MINFYAKVKTIYQVLSEEENEFSLLVKENEDKTIDVQMYFNDGADTWQNILREEKELK